MPILQNMTIKRKLTAIIMLTCIVALLAAGAIFIAYDFVQIRRDMARSLFVQAEIMADNCKASVTFDDPKDAEETLSALRMEPSIVHACIHTTDSKDFASYYRENIDSSVSVHPSEILVDGYSFDKGFLTVFKSIVVDDEVIGSVCLRSDLKPLYTALARNISMVVSVLLCISLVAYLLAAKLQGLISEPILSLTKVARKISENKEYSVRVAKQSNDETGLLIDSFNEMLEQIQKNEIQLVEINENLEEKVDKRTSELTREITERKQAEQQLLANEQQLKATNQQLLANEQQLLANEQQLKATNQQLLANEQQLKATNHQLQTEIEQRNEVEKRLHRLAMIVEQAYEGIAFADLDGVIQFANLSWVKMHGYNTAEELIGKPLSLFHTDEQLETDVMPVIEKVKKEGGNHIGEVWHVRKDGTTFPTEMIISLFKNDRSEQIGIIGFANDITDRKRAKENLLRSETKFRTLYESSSDAVMLLDEKGFFDCNEATVKMFGCKNKEEFCSKHPAELSPPNQPCGTDSMKLANERIATAVKNGSNRFEWMHKQLDTGKPFPADVLLNAMELDGKKVLQAVVRDITEYKKAEQELQIFKRFTEESSLGIGWAGIDGNIIFINSTLCRMFGEKSQQDVYGKQVALYYDQQTQQRLADEIFPEVLAKGQWVGELDIYAKNNKRIPTLNNIFLMYDADGKPLCFANSLTDITEHKKAEAKVRESNERFNQIAEQSRTFAWEVDADGLYTYVSYVAPQVIGYQPEELVGKKHFYDLHPEDGREAFKANAFEIFKRKEQFTGMENPIQTKDGRIIWCSTNGFAVLNDDGTLHGYSGSDTDITERKQAVKELAEANMKLVDTAREVGRGEIATSVLHNAGNVLNSINVQTNIVRERIADSKVTDIDRVAKLLEEHKENIGDFMVNDQKGKQVLPYLTVLSEHLISEQKSLLDTTDNLTKHIQHITDIIQIQQDTGKVAGIMQTFDIDSLVNDAIEICSAALSRHHVDIRYEYESIPDVCLDRHKALQIVTNLITNAKDALAGNDSEQKSIIVRTRRILDDRFAIEINDNGCGITEANLTKIFSGGFTTKKHGHGHGLHSAALAAKEMNGSLLVHSDGVGSGATFTLELPLSSFEVLKS